MHRADQTKSLSVSDWAFIPTSVQFSGELYQTTCESEDPFCPFSSVPRQNAALSHFLIPLILALKGLTPLVLVGFKKWQGKNESEGEKATERKKAILISGAKFTQTSKFHAFTPALG